MIIGEMAWSHLFALLTITLAIAETNTTTTDTLPGCQSHCGSVKIPYPFGIGDSCNIGMPGFNMSCNTTDVNHPRTFQGTGNVEVYNISESKLRISNIISSRCYNPWGAVDGGLQWTQTDLKKNSFSFAEENRFFLIGCDDYAVVRANKTSLDFRFSCSSSCSKSEDVLDGYCSGVGCCQTSIPAGTKYYYAALSSFNNHSRVLPFNRCGYAFLGEESSFSFKGSELNDTDFLNRTLQNVPIVLDWSIGDKKCKDARVERDAYVCKDNSVCVDSVSGAGYLCNCTQGYHGNPYLVGGCQGNHVLLHGHFIKSG